MQSLLIKTIGVGLLVGLSCVVMLSMSSAHWWKGVRTAHLAYEGQTLPDGKYRSRDGQLLINLNERSDEGSLLSFIPSKTKSACRTKDTSFFYPVML